MSIFYEMFQKQLPNISPEYKLKLTHIKRISKHIPTSIFDETKCSIWQGPLANVNNPRKKIYITFFYNYKKNALHRLLYQNFVAPLNSNQYIKFQCNNSGYCCNVNHFKVYTHKPNINVLPQEKKKSNIKPYTNINEIIIVSTSDTNRLIIDYD